jgi:hypothetical protein
VADSTAGKADEEAAIDGGLLPLETGGGGGFFLFWMTGEIGAGGFDPADAVLDMAGRAAVFEAGLRSERAATCSSTSAKTSLEGLLGVVGEGGLSGVLFSIREQYVAGNIPVRCSSPTISPINQPESTSSMTAIISPTAIDISESLSASKGYSTFIILRRFACPLLAGRGGSTADSVCARRRWGELDGGGVGELTRLVDLYFVEMMGRGTSGRGGGKSSSGEY